MGGGRQRGPDEELEAIFLDALKHLNFSAPRDTIVAKRPEACGRTRAALGLSIRRLRWL